MMRLSSPSFRNGGSIPSQHTVDGPALSPALAWAELPIGTRSLVLIMEDCDRPGPSGPSRPFVHWVIYNLQPSLLGIELGANRSGWPPGAASGRNDSGQLGYEAPASERDELGQHRYLFRLLALGTTLNPTALDGVGAREILAAAEDHMLDTAELTGSYRGLRGPIIPPQLRTARRRPRGNGERTT